MTIATNAGFDTASTAAVVGVLSLIELDFTSGTLYLTGWPTNVTVGAQTYTGMGNVGGVSEIKESEDGQTQTLSLTLSQVNSSYLSLALGNASAYQGRAARVYVALTDTNFVLSGSPVAQALEASRKTYLARLSY